MKIFIDNEFKCHIENPGGFREVDTSTFDGKCQEYIEGMRYVPDGDHYTLDGNNTWGEAVFPWKPMVDMGKAQAVFEHDQLAIITAERDGLLDDMQALIDEVLGGEMYV